MLLLTFYMKQNFYTQHQLGIHHSLPFDDCTCFVISIHSSVLSSLTSHNNASVMNFEFEFCR